MPSCCGDGQFCDFPWCECGGNAEFRRKHGLNVPSDTKQDCGEPWCNYCRQVLRPKAASGVSASDSETFLHKPPMTGKSR